jgi:hypothetical protein
MFRRAVALSILVAAMASAPALAAFIDGPAVAASFTADRLDTPGNLAAGGSLGTTATLTWNAVADTYAAGYRVYRSTTSGSGYALVATVTPRTTTSTTNSPLIPGRYYYVVRAFAAQWLSPPSNEVSILLL